MTTWRQLGLSFYWAATNFVWGAMLVVIVPSQVAHLAGADKGPLNGMIVGLGAIGAVIIPLMVGPLSDRCISKLGRRRPYMVAGVLINILALIPLALAFQGKNIPLYVASYVLMTIGNNIATASYMGVIPDLVPVDQRGHASGYMALMSNLGTLSGIVLTGDLAGKGQYNTVYGMIVGVLVVGMVISWFGINEKPLAEKPAPFRFVPYLKSLWIDPRKYPDFAWVWITRALVMFGFYAFLPMLQYYLQDAIQVQNPEKATGDIAGAVIAFAMISGFIAGRFSDRYGRKKIVYVANSCMVAMALAFIFCRSITEVMVIGALFGIGYGAYISADWALGTDVLPSQDSAGKDMAIWHVAMVLPQALASYPAGLLVAAFGVHYKTVGGELVPHYNLSGYSALLIGIALFFALGAFFLKNVRGVR